jgi:hypothetical protein
VNDDLHGQGPIQLRMFMRAQELRESITATLDHSFDDPDAVMENKLDASKRTSGRGAGVYDAIQREGVLSPVQLVHGMHENIMMGQGHHRTAAADDIARQTGKDMWVPVVHTDAREGSNNPVSIYSEHEDKKAAVADYRKFADHTEASDTDFMWQTQRQQKDIGAVTMKLGRPKREATSDIQAQLKPMGTL